nr:glutamate--cysteine ligase regulatory subunit isoform X2 [Parasteatoda tepidariorum]
MLPESVNTIIINTGNIISSKDFKKKATQSPSEEVCDSVSGAFQMWLKSIYTSYNFDSDVVFCDNNPDMKVEKSDRAELKISAMETLGIQMIDSLILSLPALSNDEIFDLNNIKPLWIELENLVAEGKIVTIGISDLDTKELTTLYEWTQVKPSVNQVNLESCCVMPTEMIAFAKENDIQLLTHNDPKVLLPNEMFKKILEPGVKNPDEWKRAWIVRYSVVVKFRGIIQNKGYLLSATKR